MVSVGISFEPGNNIRSFQAQNSQYGKKVTAPKPCGWSLGTSGLKERCPLGDKHLIVTESQSESQAGGFGFLSLQWELTEVSTGECYDLSQTLTLVSK